MSALASSTDTSARGLPPVHVSVDREIRTVVGLRPYRLSGFCVRSEQLDHTLLIHNYGHGGAGVTLSWGRAKLAIDLGAQGHRGPIAVLDAGAVGLATARLLQESGFSVTIYSKEIPPNTTSNIAGAQWFPYTLVDEDKRTPAFDDQLIRAARFAYQRYQIMLGPKYGIRWMRNYFLNNQGVDESGFYGKQSDTRSMMPEFRELRPEEYCFPVYSSVRQFDTLFIEPPTYLQAMIGDFLVAGGHIQIAEIADRSAITKLTEKLVFNCTGLGSKQILGDPELVPLKGQLTILLPRSEIQYASTVDDRYMYSRTDGILLGGTHEHGNWSLAPNLEAKNTILHEHQRFFEQFRACGA
jgi:D-amino-acid oxidase